jgi:glucose-1-phosphate adenylyltransferase
MQSNAFGLIYTGESNQMLRDLTYSRSIAAMPFAGRYRCIDFVLSSLVNTGISNVGIIAQKNYHSLMDHLGSGKEWELRRKRDGLFILPPFVTRENTGIYTGTVDALRSVMGYIRRSSQRYVIFSGSHTIYNTTFDAMLAQHIETGADITVMYNETPPYAPTDQYDDLRLKLGSGGRVTDMELNPYRAGSNATSCDAFVMERTLLEYLVEEAAARGLTDFLREVLLKRLDSLRIFGWKYEGYVARLNSLNSFFSHNMAVLDPEVRRDLYNPNHMIFTKIKDEAPAKYGNNARVKNSLVADGCIINGTVENSVLFRGVNVAEGAKVVDSILMQASDVQAECELSYVILDKGVTVRSGRKLAGYESFPIIVRKGSVV